MEIHKPHAAKTWGEFLIELGTIVVSILIALSLEQALEAAHWAHQVRQAEIAMRRELRQIDKDAYFRLASDSCARRKLDDIESLLKASRETGAPAPTITPYLLIQRPFIADAWEDARALQVAGHIPAERMTAYANAYFYPSYVMHQLELEEIQSMSALNTLTVNAGLLQPAERDRLFVALIQARKMAQEIGFGSWVTIKRSETLGVRLTPAEMHEQLLAARARFGDCASDPDMRKAPYNAAGGERFLQGR